MIITVTQGHIDRGTPERCNACPIALALMDYGFEVEVFRQEICFGPTRGFWINTSKRMEEFVKRFDQGKPVKPTKFRIKVPA